MHSATFANPLSEMEHSMLLDLLKTFIIVGGMPAAVGAYAQTQSFLDVERMHKDIMTSLKRIHERAFGRTAASAGGGTGFPFAGAARG